MKQKEKEILRLEEDLKDTLENELINQQTKNKRTEIKDIKLVGQATWKDKINGQPLYENVFIVEKKIKEINEDGTERVTEQVSYYLGEECIGGKIGENEKAFKDAFINSEPDKMKAVNELLERTSNQEIENNSLNNLQRKELSEILAAHLERKVSEEEVDKLLEEMDEDEIEDFKEDKEENKDKDENDLSVKQTEKIKVNGVQKADLNKLVDGNETLGKRLDLEEYDNLYVINSEKANEIAAGSKINTTTYTLVGTTKDGRAKVLNDEFEIDKSVGISVTREETKIRANGTATRDNKDLSVYTRKTNGMSIGCEKDKGTVNMFLYQKTLEENENVGIQIETSKTPVIPLETREIMNRSKGVYQKEEVQNEIEEHTEKNCNPDDIRDFDGDKKTSSHAHIEYTEIDENDYIPNTNITWLEFRNRCGYRGEGALELAVEKVNELPEVNQETVEDFIEEIQEDYILPEKEHEHNQNYN